MDLNKRMNDFRLASRELYNQYFFSEDREQASEAEERHSILLEYLFQYMVLEPENIKGSEYFEENKKLLVALKNRNTGYYQIEVEKSQGQWSIEKIPCSLGSPELFFQCYFDWDDLDIKDNKYVKGTLKSCPGVEHFVGKNCHFDAGEVVFKKA